MAPSPATEPLPGKRAAVLTNGCPENRIDSARIQEFLRASGWEISSDFQDADLILFNACGLTQRDQELSIRAIKLVQKRKKPSAELVVHGCLPRINAARLADVFEGFTFAHDLEGLAEIIDAETDPREACANYLLPRWDLPAGQRWRTPHYREVANLRTVTEVLTRAYRNRLSSAADVITPHSFCIKVCTGCRGECTFCAVRISRGPVRSKPVQQVIAEFQGGLAAGYTEFALLGTDVGAYGRDHGTTLAALLREMLETDGDYQIRLRNVQPRFLIEMLPELREIFRSGRIAHLSSAAESGNNRILALMNRGYRIEDFREAILSLKSVYPKLQVRTQLMVGFPSETEEEFQDTVRLLDQVSFDFVEVYLFQPRPGTVAACLQDQIPRHVAAQRQHELYVKALLASRRRG